ncbi:MAG: hypothetical protein PHG82_01720 [Candidatus Gracilibacteria bacterium]|nr:hypothetical protein [Candidatus Gracilibacteria bacterium]
MPKKMDVEGLSISTNSKGEDFRLEGVKDEVGKIVNVKNVRILYKQSNDFLRSLESPKNLEEFISFRESINSQIDELFVGILSSETDNFRLSFSTSDVNFLIGDEGKRMELEEFILKKHNIYFYYLSEALRLGKLDLLFSKTDLNTLNNLIDSNIFQYMNELLLIWQTDLHTGKNIDIPERGEDLKYAGLVDGKFVPYKELLSPEIIKKEYLANIENSDFRKYFFKNLVKFLNSGVRPFEDWLKAEHFAINTWEDSNSKLSLNTSIETYQKENILVDLELEVFLKQEDNQYKESATNLSQKYFLEDYNIGSIKFYLTEPILSSGVVGFKNVLGKSFPNNPTITEERGTLIYTVIGRLGEKTLVKAQSFIDALGMKDVNSESFAKKSIDHVAFHEYGHSLFIKGNKNSQLEETKASLFYLLSIYDQNKKEAFTEDWIEDFLKFMIVEATRKVKNKDVPDYIQYVIREKFSLNGMFKNGLIFWQENGNIGINPDKEAFAGFLEYSKDLLFSIKEIYKMDNIKEVETEMLTELYKDTMENIELIYSKIVPQK